MSWGIVSSVAKVALPFFASKAASKGTKEASETLARGQGEASQAQLALGREQLEATAPLRQLALEQGQLGLESQRQLFPLLQQAINQPLQLGQGISQIQSGLSPFGLEDSSVSGTAIGQFAESARQNQLQNILSGLGFGNVPGGFGTAGLNTAAQLGLGGIQSQFGGQQALAAGQLGAGQTQSNFLSGLGGLDFSNLFQGTGQTINTPNAQLTVPSQSGFMAPPQGQRNLTNFDFSSLLQ